MTRKRFLLFLLVALLGVFSFTGCGEKRNTESKASSAESSQNSLSTESPEGSNNFPGDLKVSFLDVGQGDSIFIELPNQQTMLIDAGNPNDAANVSAYIRNAGYEKNRFCGGYPSS